METKFCNRCKRNLPKSEFYSDKSQKSGLYSLCKECSKAKNKKYYDENKEWYKEYVTNWRKENADIWKNYMREYRIKNREKIREWGKNHYNKNKEKFKHRHKKRRIKLRDQAMTKLGSFQCVKCGFNDIRALCVDHIHNDGKSERDLIGYGVYSLYVKILKMSDEDARNRYQVLCRNCNWIKQVEYMTG